VYDWDTFLAPELAPRKKSLVEDIAGLRVERVLGICAGPKDFLETVVEPTYECSASTIFADRIDSRFLLPSRGRLPHVNCYPAAERLRGGGGDGEATEHGDTPRA
jgi:hypothetical protein